MTHIAHSKVTHLYEGTESGGKREAILNAALRLFTERGFHGTAMPLVAELAEVGAGRRPGHAEHGVGDPQDQQPRQGQRKQPPPALSLHRSDGTCGAGPSTFTGGRPACSESDVARSAGSGPPR